MANSFNCELKSGVAHISSPGNETFGHLIAGVNNPSKGRNVIPNSERGYCCFWYCPNIVLLDNAALLYSSQEVGVKLRIIIADNHPGMLECLGSMLSQEFEVMALVSDGVAALNAVKNFSPEVAVLDLSMSPLNGLDVIKSLRDSGSKTAVVLVTGYTDPGLAKAALTAGASAVVAKSRLAEDLIPAIRNAARTDGLPGNAA